MHIVGGLLELPLKFGGPGLLALGILDSSFLFVPVGNDLLMVAMVARHPNAGTVLYYAAMATAGSVIGTLLIDVTIRPLGAKGLEKYLPRRRINRMKKKVEQNAAQAVAIACVAPPPFPFTAVIMAAAAFQYSIRKMLVTVGAARMVRFTALGLLAWRFGDRILRWAEYPVVQGLLIGLIAVSIVGSAISVYGWVRRSRAC
jgi:membrane protein YqaA with SNARE-associated domain